MELETGDLILFEDTSGFFFSSLIKFFTKSKYTHCGIILKSPTYINPNLTGIYLLESGYEDFNDSEENTKKFGVQIIDFNKKLNEYNGHIWIRKLLKRDNIEDIIKEYHPLIHNKEYDYNIFDLVKVIIKDPNNEQRTKSFFCSALVCYLYTQCGLLPSTTKWDMDTPNFLTKPFDFLSKLIQLK